jgi:hypothetical protein
MLFFLHWFEWIFEAVRRVPRGLSCLSVLNHVVVEVCVSHLLERGAAELHTLALVHLPQQVDYLVEELVGVVDKGLLGGAGARLRHLPCLTVLAGAVN